MLQDSERLKKKTTFPLFSLFSLLLPPSFSYSAAGFFQLTLLLSFLFQ